MKRLFVFLLIASFYVACAPNATKSLTATTESNLESNEIYSAQADLIAKIDKLPGVRVDGYGQSIKVSSCPYFILNGIERGNKLFNICQLLVDGKKIKKVANSRGSGPSVCRNSLLGQRNYIIIDTE